MKLIHLTDTHLVVPGERLIGLDPAARFAPCVDSINRDHPDAECCIITGDLADRAEEPAYRFLAEQMKRCLPPCHLIPGNHDDRDTFRRWFPQTPVDEHGFVQYTVTTTAGVLVMLDTVQSGTHGGAYCEKRRDWLRTTLEMHRNVPVYLFMHHPPFDLHLPCIDRIGFVDQGAFAEVVLPHQNIRHLFFGHAHRPLSGSWNGISFSSLRGTNHQVKLDFQDPGVTHLDEPPEYSIVFVSDSQIVVHSHAYPLNGPR